jgi:hypothetical protein
MISPVDRDPLPANDDDQAAARVRRVLWISAIGALLAAALLGWALTAEASKVKRSGKERYQFQRANPCPVNGAQRGPCPGYVIDHVVALCEGGPDLRTNMQWLTVEAAREKDAAMLKRCRPAGPEYRGGK